MANNMYNGIGDIKTGLLKKSVIKKAFWGRYSQQIPTEIGDKNVEDRILLDMQIKKLQALEGQSDFEEINNFIKTCSLQSANSIRNEMLEASTSQAYTRFIELLNTGLWSNEANPIKSNLNLKGDAFRTKYAEDVDNILNEMTDILSQLNVNEPISKTVINTLSNRFSHMGKNYKQQYVQNKANLAEIAAGEIINNNPNYKSLVSGAFLNSAGEQLIEDVFGFKKSNLSNKFSNGYAEFTVTLTKENRSFTAKAASMEDFFKTIEGLSGDYKIQLTDEMYTAMREVAFLKGQVKSGQDQAILNKGTQRNAIKLSQIGFSAEGL